MASGTTAVYAYRDDDAGRLVEVTRDGAVVEAYEYDANGNRVRAVTANGIATATVDAQDRVLAYGDATFAYAANGEIREKVWSLQEPSPECTDSRCTDPLLPNERPSQ